MTNHADENLSRFQVHCASREDGSEYVLEVDAASEEDARQWAIQEGNMVGRVTQVGVGGVEARPAAAAFAPTIPLNPQQQAMIDAARNWQRDKQVAASDPQATEMRRIADSLAIIAQSPMIARPRRTLFWVVSLAITLGGVLTVALQMVVNSMTGTAASGLGGLSSLGGGSGVNASQVQGMVKPIEQYGEILRDVMDSPLGKNGKEGP